MRYTVYTLDMWGHVPADCIGHGCPCVTTIEPDEDPSGPEDTVERHSHDDDACQCHEDCNQQFRHGTITVAKDATDADILTALTEEEGFTFSPETVLDDSSDGPIDVNDADGRRLLHLIPVEPMRFRIPLVWRRTARYTESLRPHVHQDGRLERFGDGGYPLYYTVKTQGYLHRVHVEHVCPKCATDLHDSGSHGDKPMVVSVDVNWEDPDFYCDCGDRIPSAYAECGDCDNGNESTPGQYHEACSDP